MNKIKGVRVKHPVEIIINSLMNGEIIKYKDYSYCLDDELNICVVGVSNRGETALIKLMLEDCSELKFLNNMANDPELIFQLVASKVLKNPRH
jgi:hypothetical protein